MLKIPEKDPFEWTHLPKTLNNSAFHQGINNPQDLFRVCSPQFLLFRGTESSRSPRSCDVNVGIIPKAFKMSEKLMSMLNRLPKDSGIVFITSWRTTINNFSSQRKNIAKKLGNPRILRIHFHTFRHWKATMEYHRTKDILYVMKLLGHKNIVNTLIYTLLVEFEDNEYASATAETIDESKKLVEAGFEYVCTHNGVMLFRKRK